ncbi:MAG: rhodanese-like domain-containing protein [Cocleimonas sp.]|nr:rhodanese-like domain-containing protein [Cocleimonas sp.]
MEEYTEFARMHPMLIMGLVVVIGLIAWSEFSRLTRKYKQVSTNQAVQLLNKDNVVVIDVREPNEIQKGIIQGAETIPISDLSKRLVALEKNKNDPILVYCRSGSRSAQACQTLTRNGFEDVSNLAGGIVAWESENLPTKRR